MANEAREALARNSSENISSHMYLNRAFNPKYNVAPPSSLRMPRTTLLVDLKLTNLFSNAFAKKTNHYSIGYIVICCLAIEESGNTYNRYYKMKQPFSLNTPLQV